MCPLVWTQTTRYHWNCSLCNEGSTRNAGPGLRRFSCCSRLWSWHYEAIKPLFTITTSILKNPAGLGEEKPDMSSSMGDTQPPLQQLWRPFYMGIKVGHVEHGPSNLQSQSPYPEEFNRQATSISGRFTILLQQVSKKNLQEGRTNIFVTGNTGIDALKLQSKNYDHPILEWAKGKQAHHVDGPPSRKILEKPMEHMFPCGQPDFRRVWRYQGGLSYSKNPKVRELASKIFGERMSEWKSLSLWKWLIFIISWTKLYDLDGLRWRQKKRLL